MCAQPKLYGQRIKGLRVTRNITQSGLAQELGITRATLSHHETGRNEPDLEILIKCAKIFNVSVDYMVGLSDLDTPPLSSDDLQHIHRGKQISRLPLKDQKIIDAILRINEEYNR